jgi:hypothetical protein
MKKTFHFAAAAALLMASSAAQAGDGFAATPASALDGPEAEQI